MEVTQAYAEYVIMKALSMPHSSPNYTAEEWGRLQAGHGLALYFNHSFWGKVKGKLPQLWAEAFWAIRKSLGADFTDKLLAYMVKSFQEGQSPEPFASYVPQQPIKLPNEFIDRVIYSHLESAEREVDNEMENRHGYSGHTESMWLVYFRTGYLGCLFFVNSLYSKFDEARSLSDASRNRKGL